MDNNDGEEPEGGAIRFSNSPRRWTTITQSLASPVRSVHPETTDTGMMESINSQADFGHRTADFFEDSSEDEAGGIGEAVTAPDNDFREKPPSPSKRKQPPPSAQSLVSQCEPKRVTLPPEEPGSEGYQRLESNLNQQLHAQTTDETTPDTSFNGSVEEMDLVADQEGRTGPSYPKPARLSSGRTARSSGAWRYEPSMDQRMSMHSDKLDQRLGVHAVAYDFLLRGMLNDQEIMRRDPKRSSAVRASMLPQQLRLHDPRSPRDNIFPSDMERSNSTLSKSKKVHVVPPPIDTSGPRPSLPENFVRTPYPFTSDRINRKDFGREPPSATESPIGASESILTLSIRRANPHSLPKVTSITIPASNDFTAVGAGQGEKQKHFKALVFDDAEFFHQIRLAYVELSGPRRFFSARSLARIAVSGPATRAADAGYGWLHQPRSPRVLAYKGLTDTFSEEKILQHYRNPGLGKSRYAFVHWAHRLAAAPPPARSTAFPTDDEHPDSPNAELVRRMEQPEGLEYIISWSISRILSALLIIVLLSIVAVLLWTFLGKSTTPNWPSNGGFRGAGDRVGTGILIGIFVFLSGMGCFAAWLGVSWLVL
ncbi:hypothetical protein M409DRAFT_16035 [Zasmidium cellare ATCC 36951]|uniref:Uncharacterized protein n=1 Tax=Zasmidium cellare ATCC 36951 TaxID=1080233 RepID=A0A6A6D6B6_ZASCE|nr:uncharacterized protein M409DRAFT_16035 [Zasmidium cellare ATCC 36951]KAF2173762.1 hypothetical protein M409DRAFT_16035 [Zasmidium cellare ATCC 36951]